MSDRNDRRSRNASWRAPSSIAALILLGASFGCAGQRLLNANVCTWPEPVGATVDLPGNPTGDHVRIASDPRSPSRFIALKSGEDLTIANGMSCDPRDCAVKLHATRIPDDLVNEPLTWQFALHDISVSPGNALTVALQTTTGAPILSFAFTQNDDGESFTRIHHRDGVVERRGHPHPNEGVEVSFARTPEGRWAARVTRGALGVGALIPMHAIPKQPLVVSMSYTAVNRPDLWSIASLRSVLLTVEPRAIVHNRSPRMRPTKLSCGS